MTALFNALTASVETTFTANTAVNSETLSSPSTTNGIFLGLPVFGPGIPRGAVISNLSPLTISIAATAAGTAVSLTTGFLTFGRRLKRWQDVASQPALFLRGADEDLSYPNTVMQEQIIRAEIWIYSKAGANPDAVPEIALNNLLDAVQAAMAPDAPTRQFTLGGLVQWCRISGRIVKDPGDLDDQAIAVAEVEIIVP